MCLKHHWRLQYQNILRDSFQDARCCVCRVVALLWRQSKTESGVRLFGCYITVLFITGNWVVFLKITTWLSKLNITNKAQPLCLFSGAGRRIRHFLQRGNWQLTAMIITEALSVLFSSPGHIQALILSFPCLHLHFLLFRSHRDARNPLQWSF